jgi:flagellum-specific peptidoglycan hydrolase FlgJ
MKLKKHSHKVIISLFLSASLQVSAKTPTFKSRYLTRFEAIAIKEMKRSGVPASITLGQGILESGWGKSPLSLASNNHFGIKCHADWNGEKYKTLSETSADVFKTTCYRSYTNAESSYRDHTNFLLKNALYKPLFSTNNYKDWAVGLEAAGYANDDKYAEILMEVIEDNELYRFDVELDSPYSEEELRKMPSFELIQLLRFSLFGNPTMIAPEVVETEYAELTKTERAWFDMGLQPIALTEQSRRRKVQKEEDENLDSLLWG